MRVLWIDDEPSRWKILSKAIQDYASSRSDSLGPLSISGDTVWFAHGFDQINHYLSSGICWNCILLDGDMPAMSGPDVCQQFLIDRSIPVIIVSMNPSKADQMRACLEEYDVPVWVAPITDPHKICEILMTLPLYVNYNDRTAQA